MSQPSHPLDPLTAEELELAVQIIHRNAVLTDRIFFEQVRLKEPAKTVVRNFNPGDAIERNAFAVVLDRNEEKVFEAAVSLNSKSLTAWTHIPSVQPVLLHHECEEMERIAKAHPDLIAGLTRRGINNLEQVSISILAIGNFAEESEKHKRLLRGHCFFIEDPDDNAHVRPIEGLVPVIDLNAMEVLRVEDNFQKPIPPDKGEYRASHLDRIEAPLAALDITQPDGPDFRVNGHEVSWNNWNLRIGFTPKEGLVLHDLNIKDGDLLRPVIYRASLSELVVPYAETIGDYFMNHSFDLGEGVFGEQVNALTLGCDCVGEIYYFDVDHADEMGNVKTLPNAICMHEEDYGVLWKHTNASTGATEVRRSRRLVISSFFTIGNYDYGIFWYLYLDGTIEFEAKLTGMLYTRAVSDGEEIPYGVIVAPNLAGLVHEHYFSVRLDMSIDGDNNTAVEVNTQRIQTGPENPYGNAHRAEETVIRSENVSGRDNNFGEGRYWKVINPNKTNDLGWHPGYKLMPGKNIKPMHQPGSAFMRRAGFIQHDLWVTAYDQDQLHAPGNYVNQNEHGPGIPEWVLENRDLENTDIVLWHTFGVLHIPRPEDFPVMPVEYTGFMLKPLGFFERNPALSVAPPSCHPSEKKHK